MLYARYIMVGFEGMGLLSYGPYSLVEQTNITKPTNYLIVTNYGKS